MNIPTMNSLPFPFLNGCNDVCFTYVRTHARFRTAESLVQETNVKWKQKKLMN